MKIKAIEIEKCGGGWYAEIEFTYRSRYQFTDERHTIGSNPHRFWWTALIDVWFSARRYSRRFEATAGERAANGWAAAVLLAFLFCSTVRAANGMIAPAVPFGVQGACMCDMLHADDLAAILAEKGLDKRPAGK